MRRLLQPLLMVFLFIGLLGSMSAYAWKTVLRPAVVKGTQEESTEDSSSEELLALLDLDGEELGLPPVPLLPLERNVGPALVPARPRPHSRPPEQTRVPRVVVVWRPVCLGFDDEPAVA